MSYSVRLVDPDTSDTCVFPFPMCWHEATYPVGGSTAAELSITWNYSTHFQQALHANGIEFLNGMICEEAIAHIQYAVSELGATPDHDYWESSPGNAGFALQQLLTMARAFPQATIEVT